MIIVISDLHLMDGTAGLHYLKSDTFNNIFRDLADRAREAQAEEIKLLFMGDIYDLIRTTRWFEFPLDERPWGAHPSETAALNVLEGVIAENKDTFDILAGSLVEQFGFPAEPQRIYLPGNHDRLCHMYPSLQKRVRETLGIEGEGHFPHYFLDVEHGFFGRHGHEWDVFNFEAEKPFDSGTEWEIPEEGYLATPIGDVIACEFASRVPLAAVDLLEDHPDRFLVSERLRHLFDVRPVGGMVHWLTYQLSRYDDNVQDAINKAMAQVANEFEQIPFVRQWIEEHDKIAHFWDEADRVQALLQTIQSLSRWFAQSDEVFELMSSKEEKEQKEGMLYAWKATEDFARLDSHPELFGQIQIICYGHTHTPMQLAIDSLVGEGRPDLERVYINTGTWRPTHLRGIAHKAWVNWNFVTYTVINKPGEIVAERPAQAPAFETWTGTMKELVR